MKNVFACLRMLTITGFILVTAALVSSCSTMQAFNQLIQHGDRNKLRTSISTMVVHVQEVMSSIYKIVDSRQSLSQKEVEYYDQLLIDLDKDCKDAREAYFQRSDDKARWIKAAASLDDCNRKIVQVEQLMEQRGK